MVDVLKRHTCALGYREKRLVGHVELDADFVGETFVKTAKHRTAAGKPYTVVHDVGIQFGRRILQCAQDGGFNLGD